jgi:hypothetical protein
MSIASGIEIMGYLCGAIVAGDRRARASARMTGIREPRHFFVGGEKKRDSEDTNETNLKKN